jgi:ABC-2 type transport system permease protein
MNGNVIRHELFVNRRSLWIGGAVILLFCAMFAGMAETYTGNAQLLETLKSMPSGLLEGFGMHLDMMASFEGWIGGEPYTFYVLLLGSFASIWAAGSIAKERDQQTDEFLFSLPYSRNALYYSKAFAHWVQVTGVFLLAFAVIWIFGSLFSTVKDTGALFRLTAAGYLISLAFAGIGYAITTLLSSDRAALSIGIAVVLASFLFNMLAGLSKSFAWLSHFSLFHAFDIQLIVNGGGLTLSGILITVGIYAAGLVLGSTLLNRQDI